MGMGIGVGMDISISHRRKHRIPSAQTWALRRIVIILIRGKPRRGQYRPGEVRTLLGKPGTIQEMPGYVTNGGSFGDCWGLLGLAGACWVHWKPAAASLHAHTHARPFHPRPFQRTPLHIYIYLHVCLYIRFAIHVSICLYVYMPIRLYFYNYVSLMHLCLCVYVCDVHCYMYLGL